MAGAAAAAAAGGATTTAAAAGGGPRRRRMPLPPDLPPGDYELAVGIVDPVTRQPNVRLAIQGRDAAGWYPLGKLRIE